MNFFSTTTPAQTPLLQRRRHQRQRQSTSRIYRPPRSWHQLHRHKIHGQRLASYQTNDIIWQRTHSQTQSRWWFILCRYLVCKVLQTNDFQLLLWQGLTLILNEMIPLHHYCFRYQSYPRWIYRYQHREMISPCPRNVIHWVQVSHHHVASTNDSTSITTSSWSSSSITADNSANWAYST